MRESSITPTPKRSQPQLQLNANDRRYQAPILCSSSRIRLMAPTHPPLSPINVNANAGHRERRGFVPPPVKKTPQTNTNTNTNTNTKGDGNESEAVVWNNAVFRCDGAWGTQSSSTTSTDSDICSNAAQSPLEISKEDQHKEFSSRPHYEERNTRDARFSKENNSPDIESTASTLIVAQDNNQTQAASSSCYAERKRLQFVKKSLFTTVDALPSSPVKLQQFPDEGIQSNSEEACQESIGHANDPEIQQIEKEILRLTQKLGELRLQKVAEQRNHETRDHPEEFNEAAAKNKDDQKKTTPKKIDPLSSSVGDETRGPGEPDHNNSEKRRRGRVVSAKFLQHSKTDRKLVETTRKNGSGGIQMSPEARRKAASLGPSEHSRFFEFSGKPKENEFGIKFKVDSARKGCSGKRNVIGGEKGKYDRIGEKMRSLSLSPTCHRITNDKMVRSVSIGAKKPGIASLKLSESKSTPWLHCKKLFQESEANKSTNTSTSCVNSRGQPGQQVEKHSSALKNARFVASRYGRISRPSKDKGAQTPTSSLSSLRNVHGKRQFQEDEFECMKGRLNYSASKRRSAVGKNDSARNGYPSRFVSTPNSKAPQRLEAKFRTRTMGTSTDTPWRHNTRQTNNRSDLFQETESSNRKAFTSSPDLFGVYQEKITRDGTDNYSFSLGITASPEMLQPDRLKLPRIKTMRFIAKSPRDSGCIKRAVDRIGKKSFFASDGFRSSDTVDKRNGRSIDFKASSRKGFVLDIKPRLSFAGDEAGR